MLGDAHGSKPSVDDVASPILAFDGPTNLPDKRQHTTGLEELLTEQVDLDTGVERRIGDAEATDDSNESLHPGTEGHRDRNVNTFDQIGPEYGIGACHRHPNTTIIDFVQTDEHLFELLRLDLDRTLVFALGEEHARDVRDGGLRNRGGRRWDSHEDARGAGGARGAVDTPDLGVLRGGRSASQSEETSSPMYSGLHQMARPVSGLRRFLLCCRSGGLGRLLMGTDPIQELLGDGGGEVLRIECRMGPGRSG